MDNGFILTNTPTSGYYHIIYGMPIPTKKLTPNAILPTRGSDEAAGYDLYADLGENDTICIQPHETVFIGTGLAFALPKGTFLGIYPRSGLACKKGLRPANCVGVVDSDYRGEVKVALHNDTNEEKIIENGERIAQGILQTYTVMRFEEVEDLSETERGIGGFGSTGNK